jgi:glycerophosphoryl diester phosphodiesterase
LGFRKEGIEELLHISLLYVLFIAMVIKNENEYSEKSNSSEKRILNIAHRGASGSAPENTIAAFDKALEMNADYIELDVQMSKDGRLVVIHDSTVDRTTNGTGMVKEMTLKELQCLDAGAWFHHTYQHQQIPTLEEVLDRYDHKEIGFLIELKDPELYPGIEIKIARVIEKAKNKNPIIVQSFDQQAIKRFCKVAPFIPTGILLNLWENPITDEKLKKFASYVHYVNPYFSLVDTELVRRVKKHKMNIFTWAVNNRMTVQYLKDLNVDGIVTDYPDLLHEEKDNESHNQISTPHARKNIDFQMIQDVYHVIDDVLISLPYIFQLAEYLYDKLISQQIK